MAQTASRMLSSFEENWTKSTAGGSGIIVFGALLDTKIQLSAVVKATESLLQQHPLLAAQIVENDKGKLCVQLAPKYGARDMVQEKLLNEAMGKDEGVVMLDSDQELDLHAALVQELNTHFAADTAGAVDVFQVCVYGSGGGQGSMVILRLHNGLLDAHSATTVAGEFLTSLSHNRGSNHVAKSNGCGTIKTEESPRLSDLPVPLEEVLPKAKISKSLLKKGIDTAGYLLKAKNWCILPLHPAFRQLATSNNNSSVNNGDNHSKIDSSNHGVYRKWAVQSDLVSISLGKEGTTALTAACEREGVGNNWRAALAAAILITAASTRGDKGERLNEFSFSCVMDCRSMLEPKLSEAALGNYMLSLLESFKVKEGVGFWELARNVAASISKHARKGKQFSKMPLLNMLFSQVLKHPSMTPCSSCRTTLFTISMDNSAAKICDDVQLPVRRTVGPLTSVHFVGPCLLVADAFLEGHGLQLSFVYARPVYSRDQILQFLQSTVDLLRQSSRK